ncbi:MAG: transcription elongation factor GreAB [Proteobacteria bacterium]|nr:transcription elongation factor GreAB [Pseudomonadota bacterium]
MKKADVIEALLATLCSERDGLARMTQAARDEATHGESRPENQYDTRALEASYLAAGQGQRLIELGQLIGWLELAGADCDVVRVGALLELESDAGAARWLFVAPAGGTRLHLDGKTVDVISPASLFGRALAGLEAGDSAEVVGPRGRSEWELLAVY